MVLEPSRHDDAMIVASLPLGLVAALDEELVLPIAVEVGSECNVVWHAQRGTWCMQGARFLRCMCLLVTADSAETGQLARSQCETRH